MSNAKLWYAHFASLLCLHKSNAMSSLQKLELPSQHVCEGYILGKMQHFSFLRDGLVRADKKLKLVHSDVWAQCKHHHLGIVFNL